jgi:hypothetical protein
VKGLDSSAVLRKNYVDDGSMMMRVLRRDFDMKLESFPGD